MLSTSASYRLLTRDLDATLERTAQKRPVAQESEYYLAHIGDVHSIDDFLKDTRLFNYAMSAFGLEDMAYAKALMRKVLTDGVADSTSFANRLSDDRFVKFATTFNFAENGDSATQGTDAQQGVVDRYVRQTMEVTAGEDNDAVRLALYFAREAPNATSAYDLLGDAALWQVVKTVFGFPDAMANADIERQAQAVNDRLDIADLQDPDKLNRLIERFAAVWDATQTTNSDPVLTLFNTSQNASIDIELVMTLKSLKYGGA
jgi:hypothetical protein